MVTSIWKEVKCDPSKVPLPRSGHSSAIYNGHLLVFGGILEVTRELNDMWLFNFTS